MSDHLYAVIMAGGAGTRFWPISRRAQPKQLVRILTQETMLQATIARLQPTIAPERILIVTTAELVEETRRQVPMVPAEFVIAEPVGRDTAACVCLAAMCLRRIDPEATMIMLPADAVISPAETFQQALLAAAAQAQEGSIVTFGVTPRYPATGYGYIQRGEALADQDGVPVAQVERFVEKPDAATAESYLADGGYLWNAGIFTWRVDTVLAELERHADWLTEALAPVEAAWGSPVFEERLEAAYLPLRKISIDYALLEKAQRIRVLTAPFQWDDVGSWDALYDHLPVDQEGVIQRGSTMAIDCSDSMLLGETDQIIAGVGLKGVTVVVTQDAILVCAKGSSQRVKDVVKRLEGGGLKDLT